MAESINPGRRPHHRQPAARTRFLGTGQRSGFRRRPDRPGRRSFPAGARFRCSGRRRPALRVGSQRVAGVRRARGAGQRCRASSRAGPESLLVGYGERGGGRRIWIPPAAVSAELRIASLSSSRALARRYLPIDQLGGCAALLVSRGHSLLAVVRTQRQCSISASSSISRGGNAELGGPRAADDDVGTQCPQLDADVFGCVRLAGLCMLHAVPPGPHLICPGRGESPPRARSSIGLMDCTSKRPSHASRTFPGPTSSATLNTPRKILSIV